MSGGTVELRADFCTGAHWFRSWVSPQMGGCDAAGVAAGTAPTALVVVVVGVSTSRVSIFEHPTPASRATAPVRLQQVLQNVPRMIPPHDLSDPGMVAAFLGRYRRNILAFPHISCLNARGLRPHPRSLS